MKAKELILGTSSYDLAGDLLGDLNNFVAHAQLDKALAGYLRQVLVTAAQHLGQQATFQNPQPLWFVYMPRDYSLDKPFVSFSWEVRNFNPDIGSVAYGSKHYERDSKRASDQKTAALELLAALERLPKPPVVDRVEVGDEEGNLAIHVLFKEDINPEPWEEGSPGYDV
jgi:hypothetical protein